MVEFIKTTARSFLFSASLPIPVVAAATTILASVRVDDETARRLQVRVPDLIAYQSVRYARSYADFVQRVADAEARTLPGRHRLHG